MEQSIKNYLSISLIVLSMVGAFGIIYYTMSYADSTTFSAPAFSVSGEGKVTVVPDVAQFSFSVTNEGGMDLTVTQTRNTDTANKVIEFLKSSGVESKDIKTVSYNVYPRYSSTYCGPVPLYYETGVDAGGGYAGVTGVARPDVCPPSEIIGYTVEQGVEVKVRDFAKVGDILAGVVENGANSTSQLYFTIDDKVGYENEARAMAMEEAREKAETIAKAGGFRIGRLLSVDEYFGGPIPYYYGEGMGGADMVKTSPTIEPGSQEITITVNLRYEIK
ncbi:MAG: hypothetical protein UX16_C0004G0028 [Parcubacteria group bacterium GW2011_GWB1_45_7]|uniref:26 kDa periplasmic immunogenic protein n=3 Tax=Parcubacteria group TaxID=1794811 RepID=A0A0H4T3W5_9BACT|nr:putative protein, putative protein [uncultured Parcubacteria bacterium Rifle_16ft_4_minimus_37647]KKU11796.1 MAG: hypothetical protein UX16_C0004G0028 [Parcubacteria group bacterium GW2011_GWB1_45_7]OGY58114.1 MAG: hypothetical protein A3C03_00505 [Candidatus Colwellbacteria bacterium RIFCSPHIGHO2_02_FULL_45_17]OGY60492.1 MAG: hypothetical protein A3I33_00620 [Candidatus Colwellbacteria bacterium RIFCSPLOWO2_02_FULL_45_11]OGY62310.1 MAG: hypothetical protein A3G58_00525 [Candidatus Colwellba